MMTKAEKEMELYLHIPFCAQKCAYCDFLSAPADEGTIQEYVDALIKEIEGYRGSFEDSLVSTVFMGGGTPSILKPEQTEEIFETLYKNFHIESNAEITMEVNPGTASPEKISAWKNAGINRLSIGLQSVNEKELKLLGRIHDYSQFLDTFNMASRAGFDNINVDLISAVPGQTKESWVKTLNTVAGLNPRHISAYSLIVEKGTPFYEMYGEQTAKGKKSGHTFLPLPDEEEERLMYEATRQVLEAKDYHQYEISNYAKDGYECRHNLGYWERVPYLGIGLGASSLIHNTRFHNTTDYREYLQKISRKETISREIEHLSLNAQMEEFMFLGLRKIKGISLERFEKIFGRSIWDIYGAAIKKLKQEGLIRIEGEKLLLTEHGIDISNYVFCEFLIDE